MSHSPVDFEQRPQALRRNWGCLLGLGILFIILGGIGLGLVVSLTLISVMFFGILLIIGGILQVIDSGRSREWRGLFGHIIIALLYLFAGGMILHDPILASSIITAILAATLILIGVIRFIMALMLKDSGGWGWLLIAGLMAIILGVLILAQWPWSGLWVIGLFIAIEMIVNGWTYVLLAFAIRRG